MAAVASAPAPTCCARSVSPLLRQCAWGSWPATSSLSVFLNAWPQCQRSPHLAAARPRVRAAAAMRRCWKTSIPRGSDAFSTYGLSCKCSRSDVLRTLRVALATIPLLTRISSRVGLMLRLLRNLLIAVALVLGLVFGYANFQAVTVNYLWDKMDVPLVVVLLLTFIVGFVLSMLMFLARLAALRGRLGRTRRQLEDAQGEIRNLRNMPIHDA
ncbi:MAG: hypothetical protein CMN28_03585 [Salinisphaeraceae bacterium]|nr:hypothetical protein [Salinisphaeraceae bacterium]